MAIVEKKHHSRKTPLVQRPGGGCRPRVEPEYPTRPDAADQRTAHENSVSAKAAVGITSKAERMDPARGGQIMASPNSAAIGQHLRRLFDGGGVTGLSEAQLLDRIARRDGTVEAAFEAILMRHGPAVLACCRHVLGDPAAAEDAFQATFLVLFRRAGSIRVEESLAPWLMHVARLAALKARQGETRRRTRERAAARPETVSPEAIASDLHLLVRRGRSSARKVPRPGPPVLLQKVIPTTTRRRLSAGRSGRSAVGCRGRGTCSVSGSCDRVSALAQGRWPRWWPQDAMLGLSFRRPFVRRRSQPRFAARR